MQKKVLGVYTTSLVSTGFRFVQCVKWFAHCAQSLRLT